jgi:hypothetical protein
VLLAAATLSAALISAIAADRQNAECAKEVDTPVRAFVAKAYRFDRLRLFDGTKVAVAVSNSPCLAHNAVARVMVYAQTPAGYRLALDDYSLPEQVDAESDGTVTLVSHESVEVLVEAAYVWNGNRYVFSPYRSTMYDVALERRKPYAVLVRFAPGAGSTTLAGSVTATFGDSFDFTARAGQRVSIVLTRGDPKRVSYSVYQGDLEVAGDERARSWSATLAKTAAYRIDVFGTGGDDAKLVPYALVLTIR